MTNCWGCGIIEISRAWAVGARLKIERGRRGKRRNPSAITMNTLALHSIHRWRTKSQPFAVKRKEVACGSRDIRDIVSACTVWFTFVFRTPTPRAVEDFIIKDLLDSRGSCLRLLPCFPLCTCIIAYIWLFVKYFFSKGGWLVRPPITTPPSSTVGQPLLYLDYITT